MQKLDDLITFVRVVERGSFIAAARQLGIPPATASRKVQDLEHRLGATLLRRTTRRLVVTDAGREVYDRASQGLTLIDEAELAAKNLTNKPSGVLRVLAPYALGGLIIDRMLSDFQKLCPDVQIQLTLNNEHLDLIEHGFDVALRIGALKNSAYVVRHLLNGERRIVASPDYLKASEPIKKVEDLEKHVFLAANIDPNGSGSSYTFNNGREDKQVTLVPRIASNEPSVALNHALRGEGFAILAELYVRPHLNDGTLKVVLPEWHSSDDLQASLIFSRRATNDPKIRMFVDFLSGTSRQLL
ncbi:Transcriptional regulator, LysR family [Methylocella tundrae]|jgi:DNA-binding transcriptional LysR family regulator|uniref:Transcriptional regulator, LysR family n=1 Tax=Methylocella tundrae TaxID=227605 RepID=A0A4U8Z2K8_METTU|nr:LysR family transcriptional regulator [Methylocella tundrae]WPP03476.1 LysR family transcriptional regulator [Methylocella tundrae]VFU09567.1 Transcriptional regulator, LysR family [Methylocella tundrae]VTZ48177.1 Transcriptional regulator, LysR family [Methylocella tundrae]